jgi:hypothetical protein
MLTRRRLTLSILVAGLAAPALAHHGWRWTSGENIELTGIIQSAQLGNPHGVLQVDVEGEIWQVEIGQPWRNESAGLSDADFVEGREIVIEGEPSADVEERLLKAERIWFDGNLHDLYPDRG